MVPIVWIGFCVGWSLLGRGFCLRAELVGLCCLAPVETLRSRFLRKRVRFGGLLSEVLSVVRIIWI